MTAAEIKAKRAENRKAMKTATGERLALCQQLEDVMAVMAYRLRHGWPE